MAETAGTLRAAVQRRVRDATGTFHADALVLDLLSRAQRLINVSTRLVLTSGTLTTAERLQIYTIATEFADGVDVIDVRDGTESLPRTTLQELNQVDRNWFRRIGPRFETWAQIGRTLLVVHPALNYASSLTVVYSKLTTDLALDATALELETDSDLMVMDLTEAILLLRQRKYDQHGRALARFVDRISLESEFV